MAGKKDFSTIDTERQDTGTGNSAVHEKITKGQHKYTPQPKAGPAERARRETNIKTTQGRRGCKLPRLDLALSRQNYDYIKTICKAQQKTMTAYFDELITEDRKRNQELYDQARLFLELTENEEKERDNGEE